MEIKVNEQPQQFYLALPDKWVPAAGHEIKVGDYRFCAIPIGNHINVSEITTGAKLMNIPVNFIIDLMTETKEGTIDFCCQIGESIKRIIEKHDDFDGMLAEVKGIAIDRLGEMPKIESFEVGVSKMDDKKCSYCSFMENVEFDENFYGADFNQCTCDELLEEE